MINVIIPKEIQPPTIKGVVQPISRELLPAYGGIFNHNQEFIKTFRIEDMAELDINYYAYLGWTFTADNHLFIKFDQRSNRGGGAWCKNKDGEDKVEQKNI